MIRVASFVDLEEAERAGSMLMAHSITADLRGRLARGGPIDLLVDEQHENRALELLGLPEALPEVPRPFRPCPACGAGDPLWVGKWKAILLGGGLAVLITGAIFRWPAFGLATAIVFAAFGISLFVIPEFECRQCHRRWSRGPR